MSLRPMATRASHERLGVPPCHARWSRNIAAPAGAGLVVISFIHFGSSSSVGSGERDCWVPGIWRVTPFHAVCPT